MKFTVSKTAWGMAGESFEDMLKTGQLSKAHIEDLLDDTLFFADKKEAEEEAAIMVVNGFMEDKGVVKRKIKITVELMDVVAKKKKK